MNPPISALFAPRAIVLVGASRSPGKVGYEVAKNLVESGFPGAIHLVNPNGGELFGKAMLPSISSIPGEADLAVLTVPAPTVVDSIPMLAERGTKVAVVISSGFKETGPDGAALQRRLKDAAKEAGIRVIGPNCLGVLDSVIPFNASFAETMPLPGSLSLFSQSGALCTAILDWARPRRIGFAHVVSFGNRVDVTEIDLLEAFARDPGTRAILGYLEGISDGEAFIATAGAVTAVKPVILIKAGNTASGAKAAASHTGSLAGSDRAFEAACRKAGILRAKSVDELFRLARAFASCDPPKGNRVGIVTNAGGPGIMAADAIEGSPLELASLSRDTVEALRPKLPAAASLHNPVDIIGDARSDRYALALDAVLADPGVDAACVLLTPQAMTDTTAIAEVVIKAARTTAKPLLAVFMGEATVREGIDRLAGANVANYAFPEDAVASLTGLVRYRQRLERPEEPALDLPGDKAAVERIIAGALGAGRSTLSAIPSMELLSAWGLPTPRFGRAATASEAVACADALGYPVVLKIDSPEILHKTDLGGVATGLTGPSDVRRAFREILTATHSRLPSAAIAGVTVWQQVPPGREVIIGGVRDPQFGPLVMFGLGGIYVEILKDVSFALAPLSEREIRELVRSVKAYPLLEGARGRSPADLPFLFSTIARFSSLLAACPGIVEADINPLIIFEAGRGGIAIDARFTIEGECP